MGVDTRDKRAAALVTFLPIGRVFPNPDVAAEDSGDRQQSAQAYRLASTAVSIPAVLQDLTTLWSLYWQPAIHAAGAARRDDTGQLAIDLAANALGYDNEEDLNTALAKYIDTEF